MTEVLFRRAFPILPPSPFLTSSNLGDAFTVRVSCPTRYTTRTSTHRAKQLLQARARLSWIARARLQAFLTPPRPIMPALLSRLALLPLLLLLFLHSASAQPTSLWATISQNTSFSVLSNCIRQADPAVLAILNDTGGSQLYTLFAPVDSAFAAAGTDATVCPDGDRHAATAVLSYLISSQTTPLPYLNQPFALPLERNVPDAVAALYVYSVSKDAATSPALPSILYVNNAQALSWEAVPTSQGGNHYLVPLASPLIPPPGNGSLWDVLQAQPDFSTTVALIAAQLPDFQALLQASPDVASHKGYHTFFVPNNEAWAALPPDRLTRLQSDDQALETLLLFHTLSNNNPSSDYPRSTTGMYYSQQFYPTSSLRARDIYQAFYSALSSFTGLRLPNDLGILLDISRLSGTLHLQSNSTAVLLPDLSAYNGVVHGLSGVLPLPEDIPAVLASPPPSLAAAGNFSILSQLMQAAVSSGTAPELASGGPFTYLAPTDAAFAAAFEEGRLPRLPVLLQDLERVVSLCRYWAMNSTEGLLLFSPDPYMDPFRDDFVDGAKLEDGEGRGVWVKRLVVEGSTSLEGKVDDVVVFLNNARLYQCLEGKGMGHACGTRPTPSNTYSINDDRVVNMVHALDAVPLPPSAGTLFQALQQDPDLSSFFALLLNSPTNAELVVRLNTTSTNSEEELFTLWAPTNDALTALQAARPWLLTASEVVDEVLRYHFTPHLWYSRWIGPSKSLPTLAFDGEALVLVNASTAPAPAVPAVALQINRIAVLESDLTASNGVLHKLSGVLVPDLLQIAYSSGGLQRTVAALEGGGEGEDSLAQVLGGPGPFTLFGPLDSVFEAADAVVTADVAARAAAAAAEGRGVSLTPTELQYHIGASLVQPEDIVTREETAATFVCDSLLGLPLYLSFVNATTSHAYAPSQSGLFVNQAELRVPVHRALNGLVYAVDAFLQPPTQSIMALLRGQEDGRAFASLLTQTGLHTQLEGEGEGSPWTVFAPRTAVLEGLYLKEDIWSDVKQAPQLLAFHLVSGRRLFTPAFSNVTSCTSNCEDFCLGPIDVFSLQGQPLYTQVVSKSRTFLSTVHGAFSASLVHPDLHASNGVVHFLDGILTYDGYRRPTAGTALADRRQ